MRIPGNLLFPQMLIRTLACNFRKFSDPLRLIHRLLPAKRRFPELMTGGFSLGAQIEKKDTAPRVL